MSKPLRQASTRHDMADHEAAMCLHMPEVVRHLVEILTATDVALIAGVQETRAVQQWMHGRAPQRSNVLRFALQLALMIARRTNVKTARAWFFGSNPLLDGGVPAYMLRDHVLNEIQKPLLDAAHAFASDDGYTNSIASRVS